MKCGYIMWEPLLTYYKELGSDWDCIYLLAWTLSTIVSEKTSYKAHHYQLTVAENTIIVSVIYAFHMVLFSNLSSITLILIDIVL